MITILSAVEFEVTPLKQMPFKFETFGIGPIHAALHAQHIAEKIQDEDVLYIGTCGIFGRFQEIQLVTTNRVLWLPTSERTGHSASIEGVYPGISFPSVIQDLPKSTVISCSNISLTDEIKPALSESLSLTGLLVENLELYSLMPTLLTHARSVSILLAITNSVGPEGRQEWRQNFREASQLTADYVRKQIKY